MWTSGSQLVYVANLCGVHIPDYDRPSQFFCPFHADINRPSARFYPKSDTMHCFTCNANWTPLTFYADFKHISYGQAAQELAAHGVIIRLRGPRVPEPSEQMHTLIDLMSIRLRARRTTPEVQRLFALFDKMQALVLTGQGDPIAALEVVRKAVDDISIT